MFHKVIARMSAVCNEKAETMPAVVTTVVMSSLISMSLFGIIAAAFVIIAEETNAQKDEADKSRFSSLLARDLDGDFIREATPTHLEFTLRDGENCREAVWNITDDKDFAGNLTGTQSLTREVVQYTEANCEGFAIYDPRDPETMKVEDAHFEIQNKVGRQLAVVNDHGTFLADDAAANPDNFAPLTKQNESTLVKQVSIESENFLFTTRNSNSN